MTYPSNEPDLSAVCPHLGLADDADSHATYATEAHRCFKMPNPTRIATGHQETYCLVAAHTTCPIYTGEGISRVAAPAAAASSAGAAPVAAAASAPPRGRGRAPAAPAEEPETGAPRPPKRQRGADGQLRPRPRAGGISMPAATIGLFALAIVLIAIAFLINQAVDDDGGGNISEADAFRTVQANQTAQAAANETPGGNQTQAGNQTPPATQSPGGNGTPGATTTTTAGAGDDEYEVQSGDSCSTIAEDNDVTLEELLEANDLTEEDCVNLQVGDTLVIP